MRVELNRSLSEAVSASVARGAFPIVLSGNCITSIGTVGGIGDPELGAALARDGLQNDLARLNERARDVYLHIDLDVLDPSEGKANSFAVANGLSVAELQGIIQSITGIFRVRAAALTAYDPANDKNGQAAESAMSVLVTVADAVSRSA